MSLFLALTVFITGANRGIGFEFTKQYAEEGWQVIATCRDPEKAENLQNLTQIHPNIRLYPLDVTDVDEAKALAEQLQEEPIDLLINNAGVIHRGDSLGSFDPQVFESLYRINAIAPLILSECFIEHLAESSRKQIVSISSKVASIAGDATENLTAYRMSKVALNMGMQEVARKAELRGIHVLLLAPGFVKTSMGGAQAKLSTEESVASMRKVIENARELPSGGFYDRKREPIPW